MTARVVGRLTYRLLVAFLLATNLALAGYIAAVILPDVIRVAAVQQPTPKPTPTPAPTPSPSSVSPVAQSKLEIMLAPGADCAACHTTAGGTVITRPRPLMAHPLEGWRDCTECHASDRLVETAPGHASLHKEDCLACHKPPLSPTEPPKPHHAFNGTSCTTCHGVEAPLPTDMAGRTNCWVCHGLSSSPELLWYPTATARP